jgi:hypothetical protein
MSDGESGDEVGKNDVVAGQNECRVMPSRLKEALVQVFYQEGNPPFIAGSVGHWPLAILEDVETQVAEMDDEDTLNLFDSGDGDYLFRMCYEPPDYELGGIGDGYWHFEKVKYEPLEV